MNTGNKKQRLVALLLASLFLLLPKAGFTAFLALNLDSDVAPSLQGWANLSDAATGSVQRQQDASPFIRLSELPAHGPGITGSDPLMPQRWLQRHYQWAQAFSHLRESSRRADASERILDFLRKAAVKAQRQQRVGTPNTKRDLEQPVFDERVQFVDLMLETPTKGTQDLPAHLLDDGALGEEPDRIAGSEPTATDAILDTLIAGRRVAFFSRVNLRDLIFAPVRYPKRTVVTPANYIKGWDRRLRAFQPTKPSEPGAVRTRPRPKASRGGQRRSYSSSSRQFDNPRPRPSRPAAREMSLWAFLGIIMDSVVSSPMTYVVFAFVLVFWVILRTVGGRRSL